MDTPKEDIIRLLPDSVANQIAAGEVIQRPASVIKELVENSIDAGATSVEIVVKDAGKLLIQVIDNGKGMSTTDARMAFERHATSKIRCADDLFTLHTMGFRGEALPSIAAVSEIEVITRRECDELGTQLIIRGSHVDSQEPAMSTAGTNIKVKNLFYNFVARRRFLKKDSIELSHIVHEFERLALVNTDVAFKFSSNGTMLHSLQRGTLKERIGALFGKTLASGLIPVQTHTSLVQIDGFVSLPSAARQRGTRQFLFVNGRNMRHPYFHRAILSCFENLIAKDAQPHYFINFTVAPDRIDINVHPQKHEIKFEDEQSIWQILTAAIREALGRYNAGTGIDFNTIGAPEIPPAGSAQPDANLDDLTDTDYNPFRLNPGVGAPPAPRFDFGDRDVSHGGTRPSAINHAPTRQPTAGWETMYASASAISQPSATAGQNDTAQPLLPQTDIPDSAPRLVTMRNRYILLESRDGILIVDQHRAHTNILYHLFVEQARNRCVTQQNLLFPEVLDLDATETMMLDSSIELIEQMGFGIGRDGDGHKTLDSVPDNLGNANPVTVLRTVLADLVESGISVEADAMKHVAMSMARSAAIKPGQPLTQPEVEYIASALLRLPSPGYLPDGRCVITRLSDDRLAKLFA